MARGGLAADRRIRHRAARRSEIDSLDHLFTIAEVSAAFAGFAGVVAVFGKSRLDPVVRLWRVQTLILTSVAALFGSLIPSFVSLMGAAEANTWRVSCACLLPIVSVQLATVHRTAPPQVGTGILRLARTKIGAVLTFSSIGFQLLLLVTSFGAFGTRAAAVFTAALLFLLLAASYHFLVLVLSVRPDA